MGLILLPLFTFLFFKSVDGYCSGGTETAYTYSKTLSHLYYSNNEDCTFYINPQYSTGYYLEIKWVSFSVEGSLPSCTYDSVEVYLTSSYNSIGKFCSSNMRSSKPFTMYSNDGYARIRFKSDSSNTRTGFSLTYQLKSKSSYPLGGSSSSTCYYTSGQAGVFYSAGWPNRYSSGSPDYCYMRYYVGSNSLKVAVMDLDLGSSSYCYSNSPYFQVRGSNSAYSTKSSITSYTTAVSTTLCGTQSPRSYTTDYNYVYLFFNKPTGSTSRRGLVVGYVEYGSSSSWSSWSSWSNWSRWSSSRSSGSGTAIGASIGSIVFVAIIIGVIYGCCRASCRANRGAIIVAQQGQTAQAAPIVIANVSNNVATSQATTLAPTTTAGYMPPPQGAPGYMYPPQGAPGYMPPPQGAPGYMYPPQGAPGYMPPPQGAPGYMPPQQGAPGDMPSPDGQGYMAAPPPYSTSGPYPTAQYPGGMQKQ